MTRFVFLFLLRSVWNLHVVLSQPADLQFDIRGTSVSQSQFMCMKGFKLVGVSIGITLDSGQPDPTAFSNIQNAQSVFTGGEFDTVQLLIFPSFAAGSPASQAANAINSVSGAFSYDPHFVSIAVQPNDWSNSIKDNQAFIIQFVNATRQIMNTWYGYPVLVLYTSKAWWQTITGSEVWSATDYFDFLWLVNYDGTPSCSPIQEPFAGFAYGAALKQYAYNQPICDVKLSFSDNCLSFQQNYMINIKSGTVSQQQANCLRKNVAFQNALWYSAIRITQNNGQIDPNAINNMKDMIQYYINVIPMIYPRFSAGNAGFQASRALNNIKPIVSLLSSMGRSCLIAVAVQPHDWSTNTTANRAFIVDLLHGAQQEISSGWPRNRSTLTSSQLMIYSTRSWWQAIAGDETWSVVELVTDNLFYVNYDGSPLFSDWANISFGGFQFPLFKEYEDNQQACGVSFSLGTLWDPTYTTLYFGITSPSFTATQIECLYNSGAYATLIRVTQNNGQPDTNAVSNFNNAIDMCNANCDFWSLIYPSFKTGNAATQIIQAVSNINNQLSIVSSALDHITLLIVVEPNDWGNSVDENRAFINELANATRSLVNINWPGELSLGVLSSRQWWSEITGDSNWDVSNLFDFVVYSHLNGIQDCNDWQDFSFGGFPNSTWLSDNAFKQYAKSHSVCGIDTQSYCQCSF